MFRKVQLKFFAIITGTLIAIFIAVLGSINLIMNALMERQSKVVLKQIAADVEYDSSTGEFTYVMPYKEPPDEPPPARDEDEPPPKPSDQTQAKTEDKTESKTSASAPSSSSGAASTTGKSKSSATAPSAAAPSAQEQPEDGEPQEPEQQEEQPYEEPYEEPQQQDDNSQTEPAQENVQPQPAPTEAAVPEMPPPAEDNNHKNNNNNNPEQFDWNKYWEDYWKAYWDFWNGYYQSGTSEPAESGMPMYPMYPYGRPAGIQSDRENKEKNEKKADKYQADDGSIVKTANTKMAPVLDGFTVIAYAEETEQPEKDRTTPPQLKKRDPYAEEFPKNVESVDFFVLMADTDGNYVASRNNDDIDSETAQKYITKILKSNLITGTVDHYQFCIAEKANGTLIALTDKSAEIDMLHNLTRTTVIIGIISIIALSAASYFISGLIVQPIERAFNNQKQFISDASHELKTPLTVIATNADVLQGEIGQNRWLNYIMDQAERMNVLVNELLNLSRLENTSKNMPMTEFNLSQAIEKTALPFECVAFDSNKRFELNIVEDLYIVGSEQHIKQMAAIFIDNALKYSNDGGMIRVTLAKQGDKKVLYVYNTGQGIKEEEKDKVFERFFRSDSSRNRSSGGYGLGLAIAKTIIDRHKFRVHIENNPGRGVCFVITMG